MATFFRNSVIKNVGSTATTVLENSTNSKMTVLGVSLANVSESSLFVSMTLTDDEGTEGFYLKDVNLPPNSSLRALNGGEKLILGNANLLKIQSNLESSVDVIVSYVEII